MAESAIETVFSLFACAIFFLTCVSITGSIVAAVLAGKRDGTASTRGQQAVAMTQTQSQKIRQKLVVRYRMLTGSQASARRNSHLDTEV